MDYHNIETDKDVFNSYRFYFISIILLTFLVRIISNACFETPAGLEFTITQVMNLDITRYTLIFSVAVWPNIIITISCSILVTFALQKIIDYILRARIAILVFVFVLIIGQSTSILGIFYSKYIVVILGRFLVGTGSFVSLIATWSLFRYWSQQNQLLIILVYSTDKLVTRLGKGLGLLVPKYIYDLLATVIPANTYRLGTTISIKIGALGITYILCIMIVILDIKGRPKGTSESRLFFPQINFKALSLRFWLIAGIYGTCLPIVYAFAVIGQIMFMQKFGLSIDLANTANAFTYFALVVFSPFVSVLINVVGYHIFWLQVGIILSIVTQVVIIVTNYNQWYISFIITIAYSVCFLFINSSISTLVSRLDEGFQAVTLLNIFYNISLAVLLIVEGLIIDYTGYFALVILYILLLYLSLLLAGYLWLVDYILVPEHSRLNVSGTKWRQKVMNMIDTTWREVSLQVEELNPDTEVEKGYESVDKEEVSLNKEESKSLSEINMEIKTQEKKINRQRRNSV